MSNTPVIHCPVCCFLPPVPYSAPFAVLSPCAVFCPLYCTCPLYCATPTVVPCPCVVPYPLCCMCPCLLHCPRCCRFASSAGNEELVMLAARHYWNTCLPLIRQKLERELLKEPLTLILQCIANTMDRNKYKRAKVSQCRQLSIVLYCIVLYCIVLYCIVLYCIVLYCIVLHCIVLSSNNSGDLVV